MVQNRSDPPNGRILLIDDERNVLLALRRQLHRRFDITLATSGEEGLAMIEERGPFAVVVCDMNMPGRTGIEVLADIGERSPDTVRIMLTGQADLETAMNAVNHGNIFRFFTKPCAAETLVTGLEAGLAQYGLVTAERELLNKTLSGSIKVMTDVLGLIDPDSFGRTERTQRWCRVIAGELGLKRHAWKLETAAMLAPIGLAALPPDVAEKARAGKALTPVEREMVDTTSETAYRLICNIPRLHEVATYVQYQGKNFDGSGFPDDGRAGIDIPVGARIIRILNDVVRAEERGAGIRHALAAMQKRDDLYDPKLLRLIAPIILKDQPDEADANLEEVQVTLCQLRVGDVLQTPIIDRQQGHLILAAGSTISELYARRLGNLRRLRKLTERVTVHRPTEQAVLAETG